jgi:hypothetical protein
VGVALAACVGVQSGTQRLANRLVGVDARELRSCVGVPASVEVKGDQELHVYLFPEEDRSELERSRIFKTRAESSLERLRGRSGRGLPGFCELTFALRDGKVQEVRVESRRASGLNDDAACLRRADACVSEKSGD